MKGKNGFWRKLRVLTLALAVTAMVPATSFAKDHVFKWRMANLYPRGSAFEAVYSGYCETIEKMSAGRLIIEDIYDGEGVPAPEVFGAVKSRLIEMGAPYMALHAGELPAGLVELGLPGGPSDYDEIRALFHESDWKKVLHDAYARHGIQRLAEWSQGATFMLTKKPINSLEDLKGLKLRSPGAYGKMMKNLGASPVTMAFAEVYTSLATGVIDGIAGNPLVDIRDGKWYEVAKYLYPVTLSGTQAAPIIVNMKAWNKLPDDLKEILTVATYWYGDVMRMKTLMWGKEAYQQMKDAGVQWSSNPSQADLSRWQEAGMKVWPEYEAKDNTSKELIKLQAEFMKKLSQ